VKSYVVKEVFPTLQGEGARAGTKAVFVRFSGCNLWDGHPEHRDRGAGACASWCDSSFADGERVAQDVLLRRMLVAWQKDKPAAGERWCVLTGGEPMLQVDRGLVSALRDEGWLVAVETNGSVDAEALELMRWVTVSPKRGAPWRVKRGSELKVVLPGAAQHHDPGWTDEDLVGMAEGSAFEHYFVQPQDPVDRGLVQVSHLAGNLREDLRDSGHLAYRLHLERCVDFVASHPRWRLSTQLHKHVGLP